MNRQTVVHIITGLGDGGAQDVLHRLCLAKDASRPMAVISLQSGGRYAELLSKAGVEVHPLDMRRGRLSPRAAVRLYRLLRRLRPDVVQTWMYHADLLGGVTARLSGCRNVVWNIRHSELAPGATGRSTRLVAAACARLSRSVPRRIVACAERARDVHVALGYDAGRFEVIHNGYDLLRLQPQPEAGKRLRDALGIGADTPLLGLVGRWNPQKDHSGLLRAMASLRERGTELHLLLAGAGCDDVNPALMELVATLQLVDRVHLLGPRDDIPEVMSALDLHILASSHGEGFPNVVAEAMACGTPCVVTDVGDAALIVGDTGWVVPPGSAEALAGAIGAALAERQSVERWEGRRRAARSRIEEKFSLARMVARYEALWNEGSDGGRVD